MSPAGALSLTEGGSGMYNVKLAARPSGGVKVRVASNNTDVTVNKAGGTAGSSQDLSFTASTWNTNQVITVTAAEDSDRVDESATLTYSIVTADTVADYDGVSNVTRTVSVTDNDRTILTSAVTGTITEAGGSATFTVKLGDKPPTADVTIAVSSGDPGEGTVSPSSLTFTTMTWNTAQTVTVTGKDDDVDDGNVVWNVRLGPSSSGDADYNALMEDVPVTTTDDDNAPNVTLSALPASVSENGGVATVSATLSHPSSAATTVTVTPVAGAYTVGSDATIVIAAGSTANTTDTAAIAAVDNDVDAADNAVTVTGTAQNSQGAGTVTGASLTITDDDTAGLAVSPETTTTSRLRTTESRGQATFTVKLSSEPTGAVALGVASSDTTEGTVSVSSLTFMASDWSTAQTVTLTGVDDAPTNPADGDQDYTVTLTVNTMSTADANYVALSAVTVYAVNADNEFGLDWSSVTGEATEGGGKATFTVALVAQPSAAVTVSVTSQDPSEGTVSPSSLTFETSDWNTAQTVTVTGADDAIDDGDVAWAVRLDPSSGGDANYDGLDDEYVSMTTKDNDDAPAATLVLTPSTIDEGGTANTVATVTATLSQPSVAATTVTVAAVPEAPAVAGDFTLSAAKTLTIAAGSTTSAGVVTVTAKNNDVDAADKTVTVSGTAQNARAADDSMTVAVTPAELTITDDDEKGFAFAPAEFIEVTEGGAPVAYTVALTSEPVGEVTVTVTAEGNAFLSISPPSLTFTATDWRQAQTVTVRVREDGNDVAESSSVSHTASGGGYGGVSGSLPVSVAGETTVRTSGASGMRTYFIEGRPVMVTVMTGVPEGIVVDFAGVRLVPVGKVPTMTISSSGDVSGEIIAGAASNGFNLGPEGSRTVVDIEAADLPDAGVRVCLPVSAAVVTGAGDDGRLRLIRHDGSVWARLADAKYDAAMERMCAPGVTAFLPFATGYADTQPEFDFTQPALVFTVDEAIEPVTLPLVKEGTGDPPVTYALTPESLPPGLAFDAATRTLSGTPKEESARRDYVWTATDRDDEMASLPLSIEVKPALAKARARLARINRSILPEVSRASWDSWTSAVTGRLESSGGGDGSGGSGEGLAASLAGFLRANEQALEEDGESWKELLSGQSFAAALGGEGEGAGTGIGQSVTVWGAGDRRHLSRDVPSLKWSGELFAAHLGADADFGSGVTGGLGVSWFESRVDYVDRGEDEPVEGVHRSRMASVSPYVGWSWEEGSRLWGSVGYGSGEIEIDDKDLLERFGRQTSDSEFLAAAAGGAIRLASDGPGWVDLKGEGQVTRYAVDDNGDLIAGLSVETQRLRVSAQGSREYALDDGARVSPSGELGVRWDGGDGATGAGVEVGGGVSWTGPGRGLTLEVDGRWLLAHRSDLEEWGLSGGLRLEPRANGRGLSLSVRPTWGNAGSGTSRLWEEGMAAGRGETSEERSGAVLEAEVGYGVTAFGGFGVATPYTRFGQAREEHRYGLGWRLNGRPGDAFELDLGAWRREPRDEDRPEHGLSLDLRLRW